MRTHTKTVICNARAHIHSPRPEGWQKNTRSMGSRKHCVRLLALLRFTVGSTLTSLTSKHASAGSPVACYLGSVLCIPLHIMCHRLFSPVPCLQWLTMCRCVHSTCRRLWTPTCGTGSWFVRRGAGGRDTGVYIYVCVRVSVCIHTYMFV
jgi:hypothetical protein